RKPATLQAHSVQHVGVGVAFGAGHGVGQHIAREGRATPDVGVSANPNIVVYRAQRAHHRPLFDSDVTRKSGSVDQHDVVADEAIVPDMSVGHDQHMAANAGHSAAFGGAARDGDIFANDIMIANF